MALKYLKILIIILILLFCSSCRTWLFSVYNISINKDKGYCTLEQYFYGFYEKKDDSNYDSCIQDMLDIELYNDTELIHKELNKFYSYFGDSGFLSDLFPYNVPRSQKIFSSTSEKLKKNTSMIKFSPIKVDTNHFDGLLKNVYNFKITLRNTDIKGLLESRGIYTFKSLIDNKKKLKVNSILGFLLLNSEKHHFNAIQFKHNNKKHKIRLDETNRHKKFIDILAINENTYISEVGGKKFFNPVALNYNEGNPDGVIEVKLYPKFFLSLFNFSTFKKKISDANNFMSKLKAVKALISNLYEYLYFYYNSYPTIKHFKYWNEGTTNFAISDISEKSKLGDYINASPENNEAIKFYKDLCAKKNDESERFYQDGLRFEKANSYVKAALSYKKSADKGNIKAKNELEKVIKYIVDNIEECFIQIAFSQKKQITDDFLSMIGIYLKHNYEGNLLYEGYIDGFDITIGSKFDRFKFLTIEKRDILYSDREEKFDHFLSILQKIKDKEGGYFETKNSYKYGSKSVYLHTIDSFRIDACKSTNYVKFQIDQRNY